MCPIFDSSDQNWENLHPSKTDVTGKNATNRAMMHSSVVTVVQFYSESGGIIVLFEWTPSKRKEESIPLGILPIDSENLHPSKSDVTGENATNRAMMHSSVMTVV